MSERKKKDAFTLQQQKQPPFFPPDQQQHFSTFLIVVSLFPSFYCLRPLPSLLIVHHASRLHFWGALIGRCDCGARTLDLPSPTEWAGWQLQACTHTKRRHLSSPDQCISVLQPLLRSTETGSREPHTLNKRTFLCAIAEPRTIVFKTAERDVLLTCPQQTWLNKASVLPHPLLERLRLSVLACLNCEVFIWQQLDSSEKFQYSPFFFFPNFFYCLVDCSFLLPLLSFSFFFFSSFPLAFPVRGKMCGERVSSLPSACFVSLHLDGCACEQGYIHKEYIYIYILYTTNTLKKKCIESSLFFLHCHFYYCINF